MEVAQHNELFTLLTQFTLTAVYAVYAVYTAYTVVLFTLFALFTLFTLFTLFVYTAYTACTAYNAHSKSVSQFVTACCETWFIVYVKIYTWIFFKVITWIYQSCYMDVTKLSHLFIALCQTKSSWISTKISKIVEASALK